MSFDPLKAKVLKGKYQVTKNIYVVCYLYIVEANQDEVRTFIKLKSSAFTSISVGTTILFNMGKSGSSKSDTYNVFSAKVKGVEEQDGQTLHVCTPIQKSERRNLRASERRPVHFPVGMSNSQAIFNALEGSSQGLTLRYSANHAMVSLTLDQTYEFKVNLKDELYCLPGSIKHIQYDWQTHQHLIGVYFGELNKDQAMILNLLVDPEYVVPISNNASVDSAAGKISLDV